MRTNEDSSLWCGWCRITGLGRGCHACASRSPGRRSCGWRRPLNLGFRGFVTSGRWCHIFVVLRSPSLSLYPWTSTPSPLSPSHPSSLLLSSPPTLLELNYSSPSLQLLTPSPSQSLRSASPRPSRSPAWMTERMSPTLESHQSELVDCMLDQINQMTENLKRCKKHDFRLAIHKMEIDRIRYMISSYLRTRLEKIEKFTHYLLEKEGRVTDESLATLSPAEVNYAKEYASNLESHFQTLILQHVPENLRAFDPNKMSVKPNLDSYVFLKVKETTPGVLIEDDTGEGRDEEVDLDEGGQHLMRYKSVSHLLHNGAISLI
ncbi:DNA replication complex GINS protein SLD5 [Penaeus vannamei]|uniref:DNA replication complex GINS protein SLD5 n=1 Tax=Penaeus vannamei TaxID=6689 RepID=A0A3R7Q6B5_PENVA|nr:DNA replication complex GINS protein SLD5 [Penaeus vannamei]